VHLWVNGPFGAGKSSTAERLVALRPTFRVFDAEWVGYMLAANLQGVVLRDFQDLPAWRRLVPVVAREVADHTSDRLVVVQTVLNRDYWTEIAAGLMANGLPVFHVLLDAETSALRHRIEHDEDVHAQIAAGTIDPAALQWRLDHIDAYVAARDWLTAAADLVVDTTPLDVIGVAEAILHELPDR
jgi:cytidylate kinase